MFQIDRSYIEHVNLVSLQSRIWDIRSDHKDDPTLPRIENYGITEEAFEAYLEKKLGMITLEHPDMPYLRERILTMYANPAKNKLNQA